MASVINDADVLKKLRNQLEDVVTDLKEQSRKTAASLEEVANTWKDDQFKKFQKDFSTDMDSLKPLYEDIQSYDDDFLYPLQKALEKYLSL